jgi:DtxR family Mn-dependent transcriptional regulator
MAEAQVSDVVEEYLETIYRLQEKEGDGAKTNEIVRSMKVVPGTVTNTVERLEKEGLVTHEPYRGVRLTDKGRKIAVQVVRRHRLSERLLTDILHVDWGKSHDLACKLEHVIDDEEIIENLEEALGHPKTCPHGNTIPPKEGEPFEEETDERKSIPLANLALSEKGIVVRVTDEDAEMLRYISKLGLVPGSSVEVVKRESADGLLTVRLQGSTIRTISLKAASIINVRTSEPRVTTVRRTDVKPKVKKNHEATYGEYEK